MISTDDFPCFVDLDTQEKVNPLIDDLRPDEFRYFENVSDYLRWLTDLDVVSEPHQ